MILRTLQVRIDPEDGHVTFYSVANYDERDRVKVLDMPRTEALAHAWNLLKGQSLWATGWREGDEYRWGDEEAAALRETWEIAHDAA